MKKFNEVKGMEFASEIETKFEVYENNNGSLAICIMEDGKCIQITSGIEYLEGEALREMLKELSEDANAYIYWERVDGDSDEIYTEEDLGAMIVDNDGIYESIEIAGRKSLGIGEEV